MTTEPIKIKCSMDQVEMADILHDLSLDDDPMTACYGRFLKQFAPALDDWVTTEGERFHSTNLTPTDLSLVFVSCLAQLTQIYATRVCKPGRAAPLMKTLAHGIGNALSGHISACAELDAERKQQHPEALIKVLEALLNSQPQQEQDHTP